MSYVERYENAFLSVAGVLLVVFLGALGYAAVAMGVTVPGKVATIDPMQVRQTPPFDDPGVREVAPGRYEAVMIGQAWSFVPGEVRVPAGSEVKFITTSTDVVHGFNIEGTRTNIMMIPGQVGEVTQRFDEPGEHLIICHEYCGLGHHTMYGKVIVE